LQDFGHINWELYVHDPATPFILLLLQLIIITTVSFFFGRIVLRIGMLALIDEILAGIFLGPSVMGIILPSFVSFVFPQYSLTSLDLSHLKGDI
jgi:Kef-type K+ transport system membrane component KefB